MDLIREFFHWFAADLIRALAVGVAFGVFILFIGAGLGLAIEMILGAFRRR